MMDLSFFNERICCSYLLLLKEDACKSEDTIATDRAENPTSSITPTETNNIIPCHRNWIEPKRPPVS
jgi:hypothetical protein